MMKVLIFVFVAMISFQLWGQNEVHYRNRALKKVLQKEGIAEFSEISEISVSDSIKQRFRVQGKFFEIKADQGKYKFIYTGRVNSCRAGGCSITTEIPEEGTSEYFDYFILFDESQIVQLVKVFNYQATHGHEITAKSWLKQFIGHNDSENLVVNKNIDAISGATISVYALTTDVALKTTALNMILNKLSAETDAFPSHGHIFNGN